MHRCPDYAAFCWPEVSHNLSGKLCPIYLGLDKIRDVRIGYARVSTDDQTLDLQRDGSNMPSAEKYMKSRPFGGAHRCVQRLASASRGSQVEPATALHRLRTYNDSHLES